MVQYSKNFYQIKSNEFIFEEIKKEINHIGYYKLPFANTSDIKQYAKNVCQNDIVVIGVGGSSLGTYAIHKFLRGKTNSKKIHYLDSTDPIDLEYKISKINLEDAMYLVISKSGTTIETISIFKYLNTLVRIDKSNCTVITEVGSKLDDYANKNNIKSFEIPKNVGGRFSVFSVVGLLPLAIVGIDIDNILSGCQKVYNSFFEKEEYYLPIISKARFMVENKNRFNINVLFSYSSLLEGFNKWYVQLWGESLGKKNINGTRQALTPVALVGPIDQHSFLQLIIEGSRDKTVTFLKIDDFENGAKISNSLSGDFNSLNYVNNLTFAKLIEEQANSTIKSIENLKDIPCDVITINKVDEYNIAKLMFSYQLTTSIVGKFMQIDTYNQPGVENGKIILKNNLSKLEK